MSRREGPSSIRVGTVGEQQFAKFLLSRAAGISEALVNFMAGPQTTERQRFKQDVAEARARSDWSRPYQ